MTRVKAIKDGIATNFTIMNSIEGSSYFYCMYPLSYAYLLDISTEYEVSQNDD